MKDIIFDDFQNAVNESLLRHRSILDILTKLQESEARINRAVAKSITNCGCIQIETQNNQLTEIENMIDADLENIKQCMHSQINGKLCDSCREVVEREIGNNLFYLSSLCNLIDINLYDVLLKEYDKINTLGKFSFR